MKKLNLIDKFVFLINFLVAIMLLLAYLLPYIEPKQFAFLSVLSLTMPFLIMVNLLFVVYWLFKVKSQLLLSLVVLLLGFKHLTSLYRFSDVKIIADTDHLVVMNYNVRLFNVFNWIPDIDVPQEINAFLTAQSPDIISMQEYRPDKAITLPGYHKFESVFHGTVVNGQAIFSKFPIINKGLVEFPNTYNNAIFVDVVRGEDTLRIYNVHLQSLKIDVNHELLNVKNSGHLFRQVEKTFSLQQEQAKLFLRHKRQSPYKTIVCGDFNNTAYSYVYKEIKHGMKDAFVEAGNGFGRSYDFPFFPIRIDYVLADTDFDILEFETFDVKLSDHFPIMGKIKVK